jgi:virginiamycin B lyase
MRLRLFVRASTLAALASVLLLSIRPAVPQQAAALAGRVTSTAEGAMEGVLVSAKREGSNKTVTVVSHTDGRYSFPSDRLEPGRYAVTVRAANYVLPGHATTAVGATGPRS